MMDLRIGDIAAHQLDPPGRIAKDGQADAVETGRSFSEFLNDVLTNVSATEKAAEDIGMAFALGEPVEIHEVMLAFSKAEMTMRMFIELRNKVIEAYQEIMRMPV
jgi:flagellar hook-basal body complex protein FliE